MGWGFQFPHNLVNTCNCLFKIIAFLGGVRSPRDFDLHFPNDLLCQVSLHGLICLMFSLEKCVFKFFALFKDWVFVSITELWKSYIYSRYKSVIRDMLCKYFFPAWGLPWSCPSKHKCFLIFAKTQLIFYLLFIICASNAISKNHCLTQGQEDVLLWFPLKFLLHLGQWSILS